MFTTERATRWIARFAELVTQHADRLTELDSAIGDADHGANMLRGMTAAVPAISGAATLDAVLKQVGMTMLGTVGGTSGPLYGTLFLKAAMGLGAVDEAPADALAAALRSGAEALAARGKAEPGDKTMVDAIAPAVAALESALADGGDLAAAAAAASEAADSGRDATVPMLARKGRASYLGERSIGHQDPGATSAALLFQALAEVTG